MITPKCTLLSIPKFIEIDSLVEPFLPKKKSNISQLYNCGNGIYLGYSTRKYRVENLNRIEYGDEGQYLGCIYFINNLEIEIKLFNQKELIIPYEKVIDFNEYFDLININNLDYNNIYEDIMKNKDKYNFLQEVESRSFNDKRIFEFSHKYINIDNTILMFFGKRKNTPLGCIEYHLNE